MTGYSVHPFKRTETLSPIHVGQAAKVAMDFVIDEVHSMDDRFDIDKYIATGVSKVCIVTKLKILVSFKCCCCRLLGL